MKKNFILIFFTLCNLSLFAQDLEHNVIGTDGGYAINNKFSITYTIGELVTEYALDTTLEVDLTQGFNQSYISIVSVEDHIVDIEINVFPNPAIDHLNVALSKTYNQLHYYLYDINGKIIKQEKINETNFKIGFSSISSGTYLLVFTNNGKKLKTLQVQKSQ
jgi:hypothetical protein